MRKFIIFIACVIALNASDKVEIYASKMLSKNDVVNASGGVTVLYEKYSIIADRAIYNRTTGELELFDNIKINEDGSSKILGDYAKLNIAKKEKFFKPFYRIDNKSEVWISATKAEGVDKDYLVTSGTVSGCNPMDPLWNMEFTSLDYDASDKWMNLYNMRLYFGDIPVFYTPYFGYSLDRTRRTGLLMPSIGISATEGFFYSESLYIAEQNWWDLEITPQVRTTRGSGVYSTFRFVDSPKSYGEFTLGYFKEKKSYFEENNLKNQSHYGFDFLYDNKDFINQWFGTNLEGQSGIYADIHHMNDVDYINLASGNTIEKATSTQILSRVNMFYNTDEQYFGAYFKYYEDLSKETNDNTLQKLPTLQYHYYLDTFLKDHVMYSLDIQSTNYDRPLGVTAQQTDINIPITVQTTLFDDYLNISYNANLYGQQTSFGGDTLNSTNVDYKDGYILRNSHVFSATTQLTRAYENYTHVAGLGISYTMRGGETKDGYYDQFYGDTRDEFYKINEVLESTQVDFIEYVYDSQASQIIYHRLSQNISNEKDTKTYGELENELDYKITSYLSYYNDSFYNHYEQKFSKLINAITLSGAGARLSVSHLYKNNFSKSEDDITKYTSYLTTSASYKYNKHYTFNARYNYDIELKLKKSMEVGFMYSKRCWDFGISYSENNRPILTSNGTNNSVYDRYVYITVVLKPFMQRSNTSAFGYKLPGEG